MFKNVLAFLCLAIVAGAQTKPTPEAKAAKPVPSTPAVAASNSLPSEEAVDAFMKQMVGYNTGVTWKIADIRPTGIPGLTEVVVVISDSQGSNTNRFYVTADGKHATVSPT